MTLTRRGALQALGAEAAGAALATPTPMATEEEPTTP